MWYKVALISFIAFTFNPEASKATSVDFKRSHSNMVLPSEPMDVEEPRTKFKQSKTGDSEEMFEMSSSDSASRLAELLAEIEVAKAPTISFEQYIELVYLQKEKIDLETIRAYGCKTVVFTLISNMYTSHQHTHFILQIYLHALDGEVGLETQEEFIAEHRKLFINMNRDALKGNGHCSFNLAFTYFYAICLEQNLTAAISFFELGVKQNHEFSRNCLMNIYQKGICKLVTVGNRTIKKWIQEKDLDKFNYWKNYSNQTTL